MPSVSKKIIDKILSHVEKANGEPQFSFEFFPPKTMAGVENLYTRMERMATLAPVFVDITWGANGITEELSTTIAEHAQKYLDVDVLMHITCNYLTKEDMKRILLKIKDMGIKNILALRGDPVKGCVKWQPHEGGFKNATELVTFIRAEFGDYFCVAVAGFPEGHPDLITPTSRTADLVDSVAYGQYIQHLKAKVDAGADFILTQFFYDTKQFVLFVERCQAAGITVPIIPGIMPIHTYASFQKMTKFCRTSVPDEIWTELAPIRHDDEAVKQFGIKLCVNMIMELLQCPLIYHAFHFYTLNLEASVMAILKEVEIVNMKAVSSRRQLPWRGSRCDMKGTAEEVRPINWSNRPKSYMKRTAVWDEFPNGRWGDGRSPAYGELSDLHFFRPRGNLSKDDYLALWGEAPVVPDDIHEVFALYVEAKIPLLPWCETELLLETAQISSELAAINRAGYLTINSQPPVNGEKSDHSVFGWGGAGGHVYQKAYVEFFVAPGDLQFFMEAMPRYPNLNFHAINSSGESIDTGFKSVTALTWGVFPNREILQPTIFDPESFVVWSKECFLLWKEAWASLYDDASESSDLIYRMHDTYFLVAIVDNDYITSDLYAIFWDVIRTKVKAEAAGGVPGSEVYFGPGDSEDAEEKASSDC